jgi:ornithine cyclodeaminase/alanine dehydrogenase-like protein (mu-crystallin family)
MRDAIEAVEDAFTAHGQGKTAMPVKAVIDDPKRGVWTGALPAYIETANVMGIKWHSEVIGNLEKRGLPNIIGTMILNDAISGAPLSIMSVGTLTAIRTAAMSAVAAKYLSKRDSKVLGVIGSGIQARSHLLAFKEVLPISTVKVYDAIGEARQKFVDEMSRLVDMQIEPAKNVEDAALGSDIILTATTSHKRFLDENSVSEGAFIAAIGEKEITIGLVEKANKIVVTDLRQAKIDGNLAEFFKEKIVSEDKIYAELSEIVTGKKIGRRSDDELIIFASTGIAICDLAVANVVYKLASEKGIGTSIEFL